MNSDDTAKSQGELRHYEASRTELTCVSLHGQHWAKLRLAIYIINDQNPHHATLFPLFLANLTLVYAKVVGLTGVRSIVETALDAQQLAASTLQLAKLYVVLQIDNRSFKSTPELLGARMPCLETRQILVKPFTDAINLRVGDALQVLR